MPVWDSTQLHDLDGRFQTKHGMGRKDAPHHRSYQIWSGMIQRCYNGNYRSFVDYGGRGITVCDEWRESVHAFIRDMGPAPDGLTIERIDNTGPYEPDNCRWATMREQSRNRRSNIMVTMRGETRCLKEWTDRTGVSYDAARMRIKRLGWDAVTAITTPVRPIRRRNR